MINIFSKRKLIIISVPLLLILSLALIWTLTHRRDDRPNIILISIDTLRADHLGCYGYFKNTTPNIDKFSNDSVLFSTCLAQSSSTLSSHASMLTSLIPSHHGASFAKKMPIPEKIVTLPEILKKNGYKTISFNDGGQLAPSFGFGQGFDIYQSSKKHFDKFYFSDTVKKTINWLENNPDKKFFLFLHSYETHTPYTPQKEYLELFEANYSGSLPLHTSDGIALQINKGKREMTNEDKEHIIDTYNAEIRSMDDSFQVFLDYLHEKGLYDDALIILTSDHGEEFNEHGVMASHSHTLYNELLHVPLIIKFGGLKHSSKIIPELVRGVDILPTIMNVLNLAPEDRFDGVSILPFLSRRTKDELIAISERDMVESLKPECWSITWKRWKLYNSILFDLEMDPFETIDVSKENTEIKAKLRRRALKFMQQHRVVDQKAKAKLSEEELEKLKALGYIK